MKRKMQSSNRKREMSLQHIYDSPKTAEPETEPSVLSERRLKGESKQVKKPKKAFKKAAKLWESFTCINIREDNDYEVYDNEEEDGAADEDEYGDYERTTHQFVKQTNKTNNNYGLPYDYGSIMHYGTTHGALVKGTTTMLPKDVLYTETLGSPMVSFYDILMMNMHYNCTDACKGSSTKCKNDGYPHPRDCTKCICPSGYDGELCERRPSVCGKELHANKNWRTLRDDPRAMVAGTQDGYKRCYYWITNHLNGRRALLRKSIETATAHRQQLPAQSRVTKQRILIHTLFDYPPLDPSRPSTERAHNQVGGKGKGVHNPSLLDDRVDWSYSEVKAK
ncbi:astacin, partial [Teladorsagia circumcincta]